MNPLRVDSFGIGAKSGRTMTLETSREPILNTAPSGVLAVFEHSRTPVTEGV